MGKRANVRNLGERHGEVVREEGCSGKGEEERLEKEVEEDGGQGAAVANTALGEVEGTRLNNDGAFMDLHHITKGA